jgi:hypothetical protein
MEKMNKPKRVYAEVDLDIRIYGRGGFWDTIYIDDEEDKINKVFNHLKSATDYKVYCSERLVEFTCKTEKFNYVQCSYQRGRDYMFFCFGVGRSHTRYEICYGIKNAEFKEWLRNMFEEIEMEYKNDKNL